MKSFTKLAVISTLLLVFLFPGTVWATVQIKSFRHWVAPDKTRLVLDLSSSTRFKQYKTNQDRTFLVEIPDGENKTGESSYRMKNSPVKEVYFSYKKNGVLGVVVELNSPLVTEAFVLKKYLHKSDRLVIDIFRKDSNKEWRKKVRKLQTIKQKGKKIVVLDPGHGGEDPGAVGRFYREKDIALSIAKKSMKLLQKENGIKPVITRNGDYYIALHRRVKIAEAYGADLFVSIHTNANRSRKKRGSSIYYLSNKGATNKATRLLAQRENAADLLGGTQMSKDQTLNAILINMSQRSTINDSILFGDVLANNFARSIRRVRMDRKLKSAPFAVLKSPQIPSILFETAFISNPSEEKLLGNDRFQWNIARALTQAIVKYLGGKNIKPLLMTAGRSVKSRIHIVKRGDTIFNISRHYGVNMARLKRVNKIGRSNRILIGQKLTIPPST